MKFSIKRDYFSLNVHDSFYQRAEHLGRDLLELFFSDWFSENLHNRRIYLFCGGCETRTREGLLPCAFQAHAIAARRTLLLLLIYIISSCICKIILHCAY